MHLISKDVAHSLLEHQQKTYNPVMWDALEKAFHIYYWRIESPLTLFSFLMIQNELTPLICPRRQPRTLWDVMHRMENHGMTLEALAQGQYPGSYNRLFYQDCERLATHFDPKKVSYLGLCPLNDYERRYSPTALFYLLDGNHRAFVYAYLLYHQKISFKPIDALFLSNRPY